MLQGEQVNGILTGATIRRLRDRMTLLGNAVGVVREIYLSPSTFYPWLGKRTGSFVPNYGY